MTNPTTPFSWQMPTATDLVTDLPADFEVFGQAVATSMADLLGGTTGQVLSKTTNANMDFTWTNSSANVPQTTTPRSGVYYTSPGTVANSSVTVTANQTFYTPFFVPVATTFDRIAIQTYSTFVGTGLIRLGIYNNTAGAPDTLLLDAGTVAPIAASTLYTITISQALNPGIYWLAANTVTAATTNALHSYANTAGNPLMGSGNTGAFSGGRNVGFTQAVNATSGFATASPLIGATTQILVAIREV